MIHECKEEFYFTGDKLSDTLFDESAVFLTHKKWGTPGAFPISSKGADQYA